MDSDVLYQIFFVSYQQILDQVKPRQNGEDIQKYVMKLLEICWNFHWKLKICITIQKLLIFDEIKYQGVLKIIKK